MILRNTKDFSRVGSILNLRNNKFHILLRITLMFLTTAPKPRTKIRDLNFSRTILQSSTNNTREKYQHKEKAIIRKLKFIKII